MMKLSKKIDIEWSYSQKRDRTLTGVAALSPPTNSIGGNCLLSTLLSLCLILLSAPYVRSAPRTDELKRKVEERKTEQEDLRREVEENRRQVASLKGVEGQVGDRIDALEKEIDSLERYIALLKRQERELESEIKSTESLLKKTIERLSQHQKAMSNRLREIYKKGKLDGLEIILSSSSFSDLLRRSKYLSLVASQDRDNYEKIKLHKASIKEAKSRLEADYKKKVKIEGEKIRENKRLKVSREEHTRLLVSVQKDMKLKQQLIDENTRSVALLDEEINQLYEVIQREAQSRKGRAGFEDFAKMQGKLLWPVAGKIVSSFGKHRDENLKTVTFNRGIDIKVAEGTEVIAVAPGEVVMTDWMRGYGKFVIVHHGDGYLTVYAHLSEVFVNKGDMVDTGDILAYSGRTGSLDGPKLHFELLEGKEPQNPTSWLSSN